MFRKRNEINEIILKNIKKNIVIGNETCQIVIEGTPFKKIGHEEILLDEVLISNMIDEITSAIKRNVSKYNTVPKKIVLSKNELESLDEKSNDTQNEETNNIYEQMNPRYEIEDVYLPEKSKSQLLSILSLSKNRKFLFEDWGLQDTIKKGSGIVLNFFGPPGTGKSMLAEAIAKQLNKKIFFVNYAELESKFVGETPKNIRKAFNMAKENDAVLVFDEADSFLGKRLTNVSQSADYGVNITRSVMLIEIEKFEGIVIFTTNLLGNYDDAFRRRILANIEFTYPDEKGRNAIWTSHLPKKLPLHKEITIPLLAKRYTQISGADIKDVILQAAILALEKNSNSVTWEEFDNAYQFIQKRYPEKTEVKISTEQITKEQYEKEIAEIRG
ncbi:ATP-binding protein [Ureibacillus manganicus]|uniref:ATPase AAA n=1 Tax=Ureibacillus manganicus DSM 26584 TaxID=1384049 RepID=A0A0A3HME1_9BACL|nr:AAA family ATPase [Ureibacillus manganicus]KGR73549.1 ATPase AAA [Ureibacillus manganicus DSM 26584]